MGSLRRDIIHRSILSEMQWSLASDRVVSSRVLQSIAPGANREIRSLCLRSTSTFRLSASLQSITGSHLIFRLTVVSRWVLAHDEMSASKCKNVLFSFLCSDELPSGSRPNSVLESDVCHYSKRKRL